MAHTKQKKGRNSRAKSSTAKKTADSEPTSSSRGTVPDGTGIDSKQQSALERGGSLAQRNTSESTIGPESDTPDEITSAAPPNDPKLDEKGRASSPSFDEAPVTGKGKTGTKAGPKGQKIKAGEGEAGDEGKVPDVKKLEDLPAGTTIEIRANEVAIHAAIAGGSRRTFIGRTAADALAQFNKFAEEGPELFPGAAPGSDDPEAHEKAMKQFDKEALERSRKDLKARGIEAD